MDAIRVEAEQVSSVTSRLRAVADEVLAVGALRECERSDESTISAHFDAVLRAVADAAGEAARLSSLDIRALGADLHTSASELVESDSASAAKIRTVLADIG